MIILSTIELIKEKDKPKTKAANHPFNVPNVLKPINKTSAILTIAALMTKENKPIVKQVIGKDNILRIGFTNIFNKLKPIANFKASKVESILIPIPNKGKA